MGSGPVRLPGWALDQIDLLTVWDDLLNAADEGHITMMVMLDLYAAFDTVDHSLLLSCLSNVVEAKAAPLAWYNSL